MSEKIPVTYRPIDGFPDDAVALGSAELKALGMVWLERRAALKETAAFHDFLKKLQREWAIETGIIERLYNWDRGVTEVLIEQGIESSLIAHYSGMSRDQADHVKKIIDDQLGIVEGLFSFVKGEQPLTEHFIRGLQAQFTEHQDYTEALTADGHVIRVAIEKGKYKTLPNNPRRPDGEMHCYCPPELTQEEMQRLIAWYREGETVFPPEVKAAWLHHRFTQVHPFQDGNGRVARALASLVFLKESFLPLVVRDGDRQEYIGALEAADAGDLKPLVGLFARRQKEAILHALSLEQQVQQNRHAEAIIASALQVLKGKSDRDHRSVGLVYGCADALFKIAEKRMQEIADTLDAGLREKTPPLQAPYRAQLSAADNDSPKKHYFYKQILEVAHRHNYFANLDRYRSWIRIGITTTERFEIVLTLHGYGYGDTGIMAASAFTNRRVEREDAGTEYVDVQPACVDLFQFNYVESRESTVERFGDWLESALAIALGEWQRLIAA
jgi:prophage maintenance system killer protein